MTSIDLIWAEGSGDVLRRHELQVWFLSEHLVDVPLVKTDTPTTEKEPAKSKSASAR